MAATGVIAAACVGNGDGVGVVAATCVGTGAGVGVEATTTGALVGVTASGVTVGV